MKYSITKIIAFFTLLLVSQTGCSLPGFFRAEQPSVAISQPVANQHLQLGQAITVQSVSVGTSGITRVELVVDNQVIWVDANASPEPNVPFIVAQPWLPQTEGTHTIQVKAYTQANGAGQSEPMVVQVIAAAVTVETPPASNTPSGKVVILNDETVTPSPFPTVAVTSEATPTPAATATPTKSTVTLATPPLATPTPTPIPRTFTATGIEPTGIFKKIWTGLGAGKSRLGYPLGPMISDRDYARQRFEFGLMYWWDNPDNPDFIWVVDSPAADLRSGSTSNLFPDTWTAATDEYSCAAARDGGPIRGFGKVWCEHPELQPRIGYPAEPELGSGGNAPFAQVQFFQGGVIFSSPIDKEVFVLYEQGDWLRFGE